MLSIHFLRLFAEERERLLQEELRVRRLLHGDGATADERNEGPSGRYRTSWRARTPRARAITR
jgi:hypothetical protein